MRLLSTALLLLTVPCALAQDAPPEASGEQPESFHIEKPPELIGGIEGLARCVVYPDQAIQEGIEGKVFVQFVVDETGMPTDLVCVRSPAEILCEAAQRAVLASRFVPGEQRGEAVKVRFTLPVMFKLAEDAPFTPAVEDAPEASGGEAPAEPVGTMGPQQEEPGPDGVYNTAETVPELLGGLERLQRRVNYPRKARRSGIQGTVYVQFIVDETGAVQEAHCPRSPHPDLCAASVKAVEASSFTPGLVGGEPVKVRFTLPVSFRLR